MIQAFNPRSTAKTAEIMSRYRPIAPKPEHPPPLPPNKTATTIAPSSPETSSHSHLPRNIRQSPYLMNVWPHMQARPTRTRKRGRTAIPPPFTKRPRTHLIALSPSFPLQAPPGFPRPPHQYSIIPGLVALHGHDNNSSSANLVTLPLLPPIPILASSKSDLKGIDLNREAEIPEEKDFLQQLQGNTSTIFTPQPVRPVCSSISVGSITQDLGLSLSPDAQIPKKKKKKKKEEVEEEVESEALPAVVSDSNNKVRLANSAYKEMVGQPECSWLDACACKRICGEVMLNFSESSSLPVSSNGFSCWVTIEWGRRDGKSGSVTAFCDVTKLSCESKEYLYAWRFHTGSEACESNSEVSST